MRSGSLIKSIFARQVFSDRGGPAVAVEATVITEDGSQGTAVAAAGASVGQYEVQFAYDGGPRWDGKGVQKAVDNIHNLIAPALQGKDANRQREIDATMLELDGTPNKARLGGNATGAVSAAVLKAAAASLGIPLYQHIGGVNACILPAPGVPAIAGSFRYGGGEHAGSKPTYNLQCYGFSSFSEASYACWHVGRVLQRLLQKRYGTPTWEIPPGKVQHDRELWDTMVEAIAQAGYEDRVAIQVDFAAGCYYDRETKTYNGLLSAGVKSRDDLMAEYKDMVDNYPFISIEDPLDEDDFDGHALLTVELGVEIVGDDLFTTNVERVKRGIQAGAGNAVLLKVNQIGTITEAFDMVEYAYRHGYGVMPVSSRGEGADIGDYAVGLGCGRIRQSGTGRQANRLLAIEAELGERARFLGKAAFKP
jgi:enolase